MSDKKRVVLVDDHTLVRAGLRALIDDLAGYEVVGEGSDGAEALPLVLAQQADVLVMDISMPRVSGIDAMALVRAQLPRMPVIILSMHATRDYVLRAIRAGASAYLLKEAAENELELALNAVLSGQQYLSPKISSTVIDSLLQGEAQATSDTLTARQREVLRLLALGRGTKEIAFELELSAKTVESHRAQIMERLSIRDVAGLVVYAIQHGIINIEERSH
ncbi:MAG: response regulator containing a CheY-like receiver domain and an DNA-binding domain [Verrucomicrobiaceae bacterium]|nr:response regulator containing a CheY-like receiver domain and an DNA-binding domain [Verrucomicrobiaceae bacterium]